MSSGFRKFVEWATDSRYVPLGSLCSLCGKKLGFFRTGFWSTNACELTDGELCEKCTEKLDRLNFVNGLSPSCKTGGTSTLP